MTTLKQAAQQALMALEALSAAENIIWVQQRAEIEVEHLRAALAQEHAMHELARLGQKIEQEPVACLSKNQAKAILDLALDLEKTGRLVSLTEGQERSNFVTRNRAIQCALEDALRNATTPPAAQRKPLTDAEIRSIQCALEDALRNATTPPAAQRKPLTALEALSAAENIIWVQQRAEIEVEHLRAALEQPTAEGIVQEWDLLKETQAALRDAWAILKKLKAVQDTARELVESDPDSAADTEGKAFAAWCALVAAIDDADTLLCEFGESHE